MSTAQHIPLSAIRPHKDTQARVAIDVGVVAEYAEAMSRGDEFPPLDLFPHGEEYLIGDGWHRFLAYQRNGDVTVPAVVHSGGRREAIRFACGANTKGVLKRTNADKRRAVKIALKEFSDMSDRAIAEMCGVHHDMVRSARPKPQLADSASSTETPAPARKGLDGKTRKAPAPKAAPDLAPRITKQDLSDAISPDVAFSKEPSVALKRAYAIISVIDPSAPGILVEIESVMKLLIDLFARAKLIAKQNQSRQ